MHSAAQAAMKVSTPGVSPPCKQGPTLVKWDHFTLLKLPYKIFHTTSTLNQKRAAQRSAAESWNMSKGKVYGKQAIGGRASSV